MDIEELRQLHTTYRQAVEAARDEAASPEARAEGATAMVEARHALDAGLIEREQDTLDLARMSALEARQAAVRQLGLITPPPASPIPVDKIRAYGQGKAHGEKLSFYIPFAPKAADWTTTDTTTYSSYTVPQQWADQVRLFLVAQSGVLEAGPTVLNTANGNQLNYPKLTTDMSAAAGTEGTAATETNPVFGTTPLNSYRVDGFTPVSDELFRDSGVDIEGLIRELAGRALAVKAAGYYGDADIGTGSSLPAAITIGTTLGKTAAAVDSVTMDELKELYMSLLPGYRREAKFITNSDIALEVALMKDDGGRYLVQPAVAAGEPDTLFGKPFIEDAYFDASATGNKIVVCGDIRAAYIVRFIGGMEVTLSRDFAFTSFETTARFAIWHDAATIDTIAAKHLITA